jgi:hypothetical protein
MKKSVLSIAIVALTAGAFAQTDINPTQKALMHPDKEFGKNTENNISSIKNGGDIIWQNDFSVAQDWTIGTNGQGTFIIGTSSHPQMADVTQYMGTLSTTGTTASNGFAFFNGVQYLISGTVTPQDTWVTSDTIDLSLYPLNYITLSFNQRFRHLNFDSTLVEISEDGGQTWVSYALNEGIVTNDPAIQNTVLKSIPVNQSALTRIRFRWKSDSSDSQFGSGYGWIIDDVKLIEPYLDEVSISKIFTNDVINSYDYYSTPLTQVSPMIYGAVLENLGAAAVSKYIKFEVTRAAASVYLDSMMVNLTPGQLDTIWMVNSYAPDQIGTYALTVDLQDQGVQTNNSFLDEFKVTDNLYGHNYPTSGSTTFGFNTVDATVGMGNVYQCISNQQLNGIQVLFGAGTTANAETQIELYEVVTTIQDPNNIFLSDAFYTIPATVNTTTPTDIAFSSPVTLEAGKLYLIIVKCFQTATDKVKFKSTSKGNDDLSTVGYGPFGAGNAVNYYVGWSTAPYISLNFDPTLSITETNEEINEVSIYPNPATTDATVSFDLATSTDATITVSDISGKTISATAWNNLTTGNNTATIQTTNLVAGIYYVTLEANGSVVTKKLIKK